MHYECYASCKTYFANIVYFMSRCGCLSYVIKNWEPLLLDPLFAMETTPRTLCWNSQDGFLNRKHSIKHQHIEAWQSMATDDKKKKILDHKETANNSYKTISDQVIANICWWISCNVISFKPLLLKLDRLATEFGTKDKDKIFLCCTVIISSFHAPASISASLRCSNFSFTYNIRNMLPSDFRWTRLQTFCPRCWFHLSQCLEIQNPRSAKSCKYTMYGKFINVRGD